MKSYRYGVMMAILVSLLALAACGPANNGQNNNGSDPATAPTNELPELVQPVETGTPSAPGGLLPSTPGVFAPGEGSPGQTAQEGDFETAGAAQASNLVNFRLAGPNGEIGRVEGLVFNPFDGQLQYLVIDTVGPQPNRTVLVPWGAFQVVTMPSNVEARATAPAVYLTAAAGDLTDAPAVDTTGLNNPDALEPGWDAESREFWGRKVVGLPVTGTRPDSGAAPIFVNAQGPRDLSVAVRDAQGQDLASLKDMIIDSQGKISFGLLEPGGLSLLTSELVPVPFDLLEWQPEERAFRMEATREAFENAPRFNPNDTTPMGAPGWDVEWQQYWQAARP